MLEKQTALVVDDSMTTLQLVCQLLRIDLKFNSILSASSGETALQMFESEHVDWIFSDYDLPAMSGVQLLSAVRETEKGKYLPFFIMSSRTDKETLTAVRDAGATDFIAKPFSPGTFIQKVQRVASKLIAQRPPVIPTAAHGRVMFSPEVMYKADVIDVTNTTCTLRTDLFRQGGAIYDVAQLGLECRGKKIAIKSLLDRMEADHKSAPRKALLATFVYPHLDEANQQWVKEFQSHKEALDKQNEGGASEAAPQSGSVHAEAAS